VNKPSFHQTALSDKRRGNSGSGCLILFGLFFAGIGSLFVYLMFILPLWKMSLASDWVAVPCTILDSNVGVNADSEGDTYRVEVHFAYHYNPEALEADVSGPRYESTLFDFTDGSYSSGRKDKQAIVNQLKPGTKTTCFVNPHQPAEAVLQRDAPDDLWFGLFPLIFPLVGLGIIIIGLRVRRTERLQRAGLLPLTTTSAATTMPLTDEPAFRTGSVELKPQSRLAKVIFLGFFSLIWNGITWTMVLVAIIPELREGESFAWFPLLFMSIFVLVGLVVLLATLHQLLALTNPRLRLIVSSQNLHPGDTFTISWECLGNVMKVTSITMEIEGRESATYTRGTDTVTETQVFATIPIIVLADHAIASAMHCCRVFGAGIYSIPSSARVRPRATSMQRQPRAKTAAARRRQFGRARQ
jgi:hypothetical protein